MYCVIWFNHTVLRFMVAQHGHSYLSHLCISYKFIWIKYVGNMAFCTTHSNYCHLLSGLQAITNLVYGRCSKLVSLALCSNNSIVCMVYSVALNNCRNFVGYNRKYGLCMHLVWCVISIIMIIIILLESLLFGPMVGVAPMGLSQQLWLLTETPKAGL